MGGVNGRCEWEVCTVWEVCIGGVTRRCQNYTGHTHSHTTRARMRSVNERCEWEV